jgi:hypothetical protein
LLLPTNCRSPVAAQVMSHTAFRQSLACVSLLYQLIKLAGCNIFLIVF